MTAVNTATAVSGRHMRLIAVYHKGANLRHISHLDVQRTIQRAFRRADIPLAFSNGFNPHPDMAFASALATGTSSDAEWFDVNLTEALEPKAFEERVNAVLPYGFFVSDAFEAPDGFGTLTSKTLAADYDVMVHFDRVFSWKELTEAIDDLLSSEIMIEKRTKGGIKPFDIRPQILKVSVKGIEDNTVSLRVLGKLLSDGGLRVERFISALSDRLGAVAASEIHRTAMYFAADGLLPRLPSD